MYTIIMSYNEEQDAAEAEALKMDAEKTAQSIIDSVPSDTSDSEAVSKWQSEALNALNDLYNRASR